MNEDLQEEAEDFFEMMQEAILIGKENNEMLKKSYDLIREIHQYIFVLKNPTH